MLWQLMKAGYCGLMEELKNVIQEVSIYIVLQLMLSVYFSFLKLFQVSL